MNVDVITQIGAVNRAVSDRDHQGKVRRVVSASRTFATSPDDLWEAITKPERLARWFGSVSGDFRLGGSFQIQDNAKGEVTACKPPEMLAVSWKMYGDESWVQAHLSPSSDGGTLLKVEHILSRRGSIGLGTARARRAWVGSYGCWAFTSISDPARPSLTSLSAGA